MRTLDRIMSRQLDVHPDPDVPFKKILYWNDAITLGDRENRNFGVGVGRDRYKAAGCPVWQCETTQWDPETMSPQSVLEFDAILFNLRTLNVSDLPAFRSSRQRYIFFSHEPPQVSVTFSLGNFKWETINDFFNWTMTYRWYMQLV